jgi:excisionase family DNA binding protein
MAIEALQFGTRQAAEKLGVSKPTLLRWFREGRATDPAKRDRNGWRIFSQDDIDTIKQQVVGL